MTVKNLHVNARKANAYEDNVSIVEYLNDNSCKVVFVDLCCMFYSLLQRTKGTALLQAHLYPEGSICSWHYTQLNTMFSHGYIIEYPSGTKLEIFMDKLLHQVRCFLSA